MGQAVMRGFFTWVPWIFLLFIPAVTMKLWAEEKKIGTVEILMTLPIKDYEVVIGKYLASFCLLGVTILLSLSIPTTVAYLGEPRWRSNPRRLYRSLPDGRRVPRYRDVRLHHHGKPDCRLYPGHCDVLWTINHR